MLRLNSARSVNKLSLQWEALRITHRAIASCEHVPRVPQITVKFIQISAQHSNAELFFEGTSSLQALHRRKQQQHREIITENGTNCCVCAGAALLGSNYIKNYYLAQLLAEFERTRPRRSSSRTRSGAVASCSTCFVANRENFWARKKICVRMCGSCAAKFRFVADTIMEM